MLLDSVWQIHGDVTAHTYAQIQRAAVAHYRRGGVCQPREKLYIFSLSFLDKFTQKKLFFSPLFLNHLMHPPSHFHADVAVKSYLIYRLSESIWIGQFRGSACEMRMHSIAHIVKESERAVLTVFPHLVSFYNKFFVY